MTEKKTLSWPGNVSWSAWNSFRDCERRHYYEKVLSIPPSNSVDDKYSKFGNCVHSAIEHYSDYKSSTKSVAHFWEVYKLEQTSMNMQSAIAQVEYAINLDYKFSHKEEVVKFNIDNLNFKLIIDGTLEDGSVLDWKTSTFNTKKVEEYKQQLLWYTWGAWKHKGKIPPKAILVFTKAQKIFEWAFTLEELEVFEKNIFIVIKNQNAKKTFDDFAPNYSSCFWCRYKTKCKTDDLLDTKDFTVEVLYDHDYIQIKTPMQSLFNDVVEEELSYELDDAYFVKKAMLSRGVKNFNTTKKLYNREKQRAPIGFSNKIKELITQFGEYTKRRMTIIEKDLRILDFKSIKVPRNLVDVELRKYQNDAVRYIMDNPINITEICTGAGKTIIAAEVIRRLTMPTLFVVDRNILLTQTVKEFKKHFDSVGTMTEGEIVSGDIMVASIQTIMKLIAKDPVYKNMLSQYGVVIIDEAHGSKSKSYQKLIKCIAAKHRIALTGTAYSEGNDSLELYKSFGFPEFRIRARTLIDAGYLVEPVITFLNYDEGFVTNGAYDEVYDQVLKCDGRIEQILATIMHNREKNQLVMCDRLEHIEIIAKELGVSQCHVITGSTKKKSRQDIIDIFLNSKGNILIATSSIIQKGVDIPTLDVIINYSANMSTVKTIQCLGRVLRKSPGKDKAWYYDFNDTNKKLKKHTNERVKALINQGYEIETFI